MSRELYERGERCEWLGKRVPDMTREELVAFIGQLDYLREQTFQMPDEMIALGHYLNSLLCLNCGAYPCRCDGDKA